MTIHMSLVIPVSLHQHVPRSVRKYKHVLYEISILIITFIMLSSSSSSSSSSFVSATSFKLGGKYHHYYHPHHFSHSQQKVPATIEDCCYYYHLHSFRGGATGGTKGGGQGGDIGGHNCDSDDSNDNSHDDNEEAHLLDAYVEQLIAGVEEVEEDENDKEESDKEETDDEETDYIHDENDKDANIHDNLVVTSDDELRTTDGTKQENNNNNNNNNIDISPKKPKEEEIGEAIKKQEQIVIEYDKTNNDNSATAVDNNDIRISSSSLSYNHNTISKKKRKQHQRKRKKQSTITKTCAIQQNEKEEKENDDFNNTVNKGEGEDSSTQQEQQPQKLQEQQQDHHQQHQQLQNIEELRKQKQQSVKPPNSIQRFLLHKGQIGRSITTLFILINDFVYTYIPELYAIISILLHKVLPQHWLEYNMSGSSFGVGGHHRRYNGSYKHGKYGQLDDYNLSKKDQAKSNIPKVHSHYDAFISSNQSLGGKKMTKEQKKKLDQIALDKLKQVSKQQRISSGVVIGGNGVSDDGGVGMKSEFKDGGIYTHLSLRFMKRYNLGHFAQEKKIFDDMIGVLADSSNLNDLNDDKMKDSIQIKGNGDDKESYYENDLIGSNNDHDDDSDDDWVAKAFLLSDDNPMEDGISIEDFYGDYERDREARKNIDILEAAYASKEDLLSKKKKQIKMKSDKDGGSGMLGRLRAASTKNGVSSRIFGAYPGDAVSIEKAASANGVIALAERYGYGDWSDDDDDDDGIGFEIDDDYDASKKKVTRTRRRQKKKRKKSTQTESGASRHRGMFINGSGDDNETGVSISLSLGDSPGMSLNFGKSSSASSRTKRRIRNTRTPSINVDRKKTQEKGNNGVSPRPVSLRPVPITSTSRKHDNNSIIQRSNQSASATTIKRPTIHSNSRSNLSEAQSNILNHQLTQRAKKKDETDG